MSESKPWRPVFKVPTWTTKNGRDWDISKMTDSHLLNSATSLLRYHAGKHYYHNLHCEPLRRITLYDYVVKQNPMLKYIREEIEHRGLQFPTLV